MCKYCEREESLFESYDGGIMNVNQKIYGETLETIIDVGRTSYVTHTYIEYCPKCGKKLTDLKNNSWVFNELKELKKQIKEIEDKL